MDSNTLSQVWKCAREQIPTLSNGFSFWDLKVSRCPKFLDWGFGEPSYFVKIEPSLDNWKGFEKNYNIGGSHSQNKNSWHIYGHMKGHD
jgi:hypothetical protein